MEEKTTVDPAATAPFRWGCLLRGGIGCLGLLTGAVLALALLAPTIASGFAPDLAEEFFSDRYEGAIEVASVDLAWFSPQELQGLRLLDPTGQEVGTASATLPSLKELVTRGWRRPGTVAVELTADLVADAAGVTNLQRALRPRERGGPGGGGGSSESTSPGPLEELEATLHIVAPRITWSDAARRAAGEAPFALRDLDLELHLGAAAEVSVLARAAFGDGRLVLDAVFSLPAPGTGGVPSDLALNAEVDRLPTGLVDALAGLDGELVAWLGESLMLRAKLEGDSRAGTLDVALDAERLQASLRAALTDGVVELLGEDAARCTLRPTPALLERLRSAALAAGVELAPVDPEAAFELVVASLELPLIDWLARLRGGPAGQPALAEQAKILRRGHRIEADLHLGGWRVSKAESGAWDVAGLTGTAHVISGEAGVDAGLRLHGELSGAAPRPIELAISSDRLGALLEAAGSGHLDETTIRLNLRGLPTALLLQPGGGETPGPEETIAETLGESLDLGCVLRPHLSPGEPLKVGTELRAVTPTCRLRVAGELRAREALAALGDGRLPDLEGELTLHDPLRLTRFLPQGSGELRDVLRSLLGDEARIAFASGVTPAGRALRLDLATGQSAMHVAGTLGPVGFATAAGEELTIRLPSAALPLADLLPEGAGALRVVAESGPLEVVLREVTLPLAALEPAPGALPAGLAAAFELTVPDLVYTGVSGAEALRLTALQGSGRIAPDARAELELRATLPAQPAGAVAVQVHCEDLAQPFELAPSLTVDAQLETCPTAQVDALLRQEGLLVDVLGERVDGRLRGSWPTSEGEPWRLSMTSPRARLELVGDLAAGELVAVGEQGIDASLGLTPLFSRRIVGPLLPLLVQVTQPEGASPVRLEARNFRLPLDGDLSRLDARLRLDLGEVAYQLLPELERLRAAAGDRTRKSKTTRIPVLDLAITGGVAEYRSFPVSIDGRVHLFNGKVDLARRTFDLGTEVPLGSLGRDWARSLEQAREYLDPELAVPLRLSGSWTRPRLSVESDFLGRVAEQALQRGIESQLQKLFDRD